MKRVRQHDADNWMVKFLRALRSCRKDLQGKQGALGASSRGNAPVKLVSG
jgi:hypothetical protein